MNIRFGGGFFGRFLYAGKTNRIGNANDGKGEVRKCYPNQFTVIAYAENGTKTAFFGSGIEKSVSILWCMSRSARTSISLYQYAHL